MTFPGSLIRHQKYVAADRRLYYLHISSHILYSGAASGTVETQYNEGKCIQTTKKVLSRIIFRYPFLWV